MLIRQSGALRYGASYDASGGMAAGASRTILAAASNTKGAILHRLDWYAISSSTAFMAVIAHTAAPTALTDGDILVLSGTDKGLAGGASNGGVVNLERALHVPAGKGIYLFAGTIITGDVVAALYTLKG